MSTQSSNPLCTNWPNTKLAPPPCRPSTGPWQRRSAADASLTDALFVQSGGIVSLRRAAAGTAQLRLVSAVQEEMNALPEEDFTIPFGSLTNNSLLSGLGPGWRMQVQPKGYAEGHIREATESLSINTTRYSAVLQLSVTVNMILDGRTLPR